MSGVKWLSTTPLWPQANGLVERTNRSILKVLKIAALGKADLQKEFRKFLIAYRSTPHTGTGCTPYSLMFGREMRTKLPQLDYSADNLEVARDRDREYKLKYKDYADRRAVERDIKEGDSVVMKNERHGKLEPNFSPERYTVLSKTGSDLVCESQSGTTVRRNIQCAKKLEVAEGVDGNEVSDLTVGAGVEKPAAVSMPVDPPPTPDPTEQSGRTSGRVRQPPARFKDYVVYK